MGITNKKNTNASTNKITKIIAICMILFLSILAVKHYSSIRNDKKISTFGIVTKIKARGHFNYEYSINNQIYVGHGVSLGINVGDTVPIYYYNNHPDISVCCE